MREPSATPMGTVDTIATTKSSASSSHARASRTRWSTIMMPGITIAMTSSSVVEANIRILPTRYPSIPFGVALARNSVPSSQSAVMMGGGPESLP